MRELNEVIDLAETRGKQLAALRAAAQRLLRELRGAGYKSDVYYKLIGQVSDTAAAAAQWVRVPEYEPIETAPKDGSDVRIVYNGLKLPAYWCDDLERWVLIRQWTLDSFLSKELDGWILAAPTKPEPEDGDG